MPGEVMKLINVPQDTQLLAPAETTLRISPGVLQIIEDELAMTDEQLEGARSDVDNITQRQVQRILG